MVNRNLINTSTYEGDITTYTYTHDGNRLTKIVETDGDDSATYNIAY